jgi:hypothetical protein
LLLSEKKRRNRRLYGKRDKGTRIAKSLENPVFSRLFAVKMLRIATGFANVFLPE